MRIAALSDLHLGFRAFQATHAGRNAREVDVEQAWENAVTQVIAARPDLVTIAGDVFHHPRVSDFAKRAFLAGLARILEETAAYVVVLQGNHDAGRTAEVLTPIALAQVVDQDSGRKDVSGARRLYLVTEPQRIRFVVGPEWTPSKDRTELVSVACFPFTTGKQATYELAPEPKTDVNILLMHAAVKGDHIPWFYGGDRALDIKKEAHRWDAIILGDYHEFTRLHPEHLAFYSGSLERTSSNIWQEEAPKGWVLVDTKARTLEFVEVPTRGMASLDVSDLPDVPTAEVVNDLLAEVLRQGESYAGAIVRLKADDFPIEEREHIDWSLVRKLRDVCFHFYLDIRYRALEAADLGDRRERGQALSLVEEALAFFESDPREVRGLALRYLEVEADAEDVLEEVGAHG